MNMSGIMRLGFVEIQVDDLEEARNFYGQVLGLLETASKGDKLYFKCWDEYDHHSVVLRKADGPGLVKVGWKVESDRDLDELESRIEAYGAPVKRISRGEELAMGEAISFLTPSGHTMELYHDVVQVGKAVSPPDIAPQGLPGIAPPYLDHLVISAEDPEDSVNFMTSVLGFRVTERVLDPEGRSMFNFLSRVNKPHDILIGKGPNGRFHHVAFSVNDWNEVRRAAEILANNSMKVEVPPSQHGATRGSTTYFHDVAGNRLETFAGGYLTYPDFPTITWTAEHMEKCLFFFGGPSDVESFMQYV
jgi:catechol 2,3-dioxygenase